MSDWDITELAAGENHRWVIGPLTLWLTWSDAEWRIAVEHAENGGGRRQSQWHARYRSRSGGIADLGALGR